MENIVLFDSKGFNDYIYWQATDKKITRRINELIKSIQREGPLQGFGKPEVLKGKGCYSRRIDDKNRLVYNFDSDNEVKRTFITSCREHYPKEISNAKKTLLKGLEL